MSKHMFVCALHKHVAQLFLHTSILWSQLLQNMIHQINMNKKMSYTHEKNKQNQHYDNRKYYTNYIFDASVCVCVDWEQQSE